MFGLLVWSDCCFCCFRYTGASECEWTVDPAFEPMRLSSIIYFASAAVTVDSSHMLHHHLLRGVDLVRLQILSVEVCRQCGSWSVAGHSHRKIVGRHTMNTVNIWYSPNDCRADIMLVQVSVVLELHWPFVT